MKHWIIVLSGVLASMGASAELTAGPRHGGQCMVFEHRDMQGAKMRLANGDRVSFAREDLGNTTWREKPSWNDALSSARIDPGCHLRVWEHMAGTGAMKEWHGGSKGLLVYYVGDRWNDRVSSAVCHCN